MPKTYAIVSRLPREGWTLTEREIENAITAIELNRLKEQQS